MKETLSIVAVILTFISYIPYYRDILSRKISPHIYTWSLWGLLTILIAILQIKGHAGSAFLVTLSAGILCVGVVALSFKNGKKEITTSDTIASILSLVAIVFWLIAKQPVVSIVLLVSADMLAFIPTIRKSWYKPHSETLSLYVTNTLRFILAFLAIENYNLLSSLWVVSWVAANGLFSLMLFIRRRQMRNTRDLPDNTPSEDEVVAEAEVKE